MKFFYINHNFNYEMDNICRLFISTNRMRDESDDFVKTKVTDGEVIAEVCLNCKICRKTLLAQGDEKEIERVMAIALYEAFVELTGITSPWGILTGIRPVKLMKNIAAKHDEKYAIDYFKEKFLVSEEKTSLCYEIMKNEDKILSLSKPNSFSLYVAVPFCPTRCSYCSFVSHSIEKTRRLIPRYLELLSEEIKCAGDIAKRQNLYLETVYIGGGTPTTLSADELALLIDTISSCFDVKSCREFTVEAGRPDTITADKLQVLRDRGVTRISINPQTMLDKTLQDIGRDHSTYDTDRAFKLSEKFLFDSINADLIAGLPGETYDDFKFTLDKVLLYNPNNITVHTLAMKRSSRINKSCNFEPNPIETNKMLIYSKEKLSSMGYKAYYLYRQSNMVGNLENVGWAKENSECFYNAYIMDETHTILACGASAVSKIKQVNGNRLERVFNYKYPYEYIDRFQEILNRKMLTQEKIIKLRGNSVEKTK